MLFVFSSTVFLYTRYGFNIYQIINMLLSFPSSTVELFEIDSNKSYIRFKEKIFVLLLFCIFLRLFVECSTFLHGPSTRTYVYFLKFTPSFHGNSPLENFQDKNKNKGYL